MTFTPREIMAGITDTQRIQLDGFVPIYESPPADKWLDALAAFEAAKQCITCGAPEVFDGRCRECLKALVEVIGPSLGWTYQGYPVNTVKQPQPDKPEPTPAEIESQRKAECIARAVGRLSDGHDPRLGSMRWEP